MRNAKHTKSIKTNSVYAIVSTALVSALTVAIIAFTNAKIG